MKILFISEEYLKEKSAIEQNADPELLKNTIAVVQDMQLRPVIGDALYEQLGDAIYALKTNGVALPSMSKLLIDEYIKPFLMYSVLVDIILIGNYRVSNKGVLKLSDTNASNPSTAEINHVKNYYEGYLSHYKKRLIDFLYENKLLKPGADTNTTSNKGGWFLEKDSYNPASYQGTPIELTEIDPVWNLEKSGYYQKTEVDSLITSSQDILTTVIDSKSDVNHTHSMEDVTGLQEYLSTTYLTEESDTLASVTARGGTTSSSVDFRAGFKLYNNNSNDLMLYHGEENSGAGVIYYDRGTNSLRFYAKANETNSDTSLGSLRIFDGGQYRFVLTETNYTSWIVGKAGGTFTGGINVPSIAHSGTLEISGNSTYKFTVGSSDMAGLAALGNIRSISGNGLSINGCANIGNGPSPISITGQHIGFISRVGAAYVEAMRITSSNVLIGTTTDNGQKLQLNGNMSLVGTGGGYIYGDTTNAYVRLSHNSGAMLGYTTSYFTIGGAGYGFNANLGNGNRSYINYRCASGMRISDFNSTTDPQSDGLQAVIALDSSTKGFLPPRMTETQRNAIPTPPAGLILYNNTTNTMNYWNGTAWVSF